MNRKFQSYWFVFSILLASCSSDEPAGDAPPAVRPKGGVPGSAKADLPGSAPAPGGPRSAIVQLFNWPFRAIEAELCNLRSLGFSHVHVSPPQQSNPSSMWWGRYQPDDFRVVAGPLGSEAEFRSMTEQASACGILVIADVVINHMANFALNRGDLYYPRGCDRTRPLNSGAGSCVATPDFFHNEECIGDYGNHCAVLYGRICGGNGDRGLPDLATGYCDGGVVNRDSRNYRPEVFAMIKTYLLYLQSLGVRAFRVDAAKHMHPAFLYDLFTDAQVKAGTDYAYGEIITANVGDPTLQIYRHIPDLDFMDFPLTRSLIDAFRFGGNLGALERAQEQGGALDGLSSVSFVTNHDVWGNESGLGYRFSNYEDEVLAHLYVLGRAEGLAYVYSEYDDGPSANYREAAQNYIRFHQRPVIRKMLAFRTLLLGRAENTDTQYKWAAPNHLAFARGRLGLVAINKSGDPWVMGEVDTGLADGTYIDVLTGEPVEVRGQRASMDVPARGGVMLLRADLCPTGTCAL